MTNDEQASAPTAEELLDEQELLVDREIEDWQQRYDLETESATGGNQERSQSEQAQKGGYST